MGWWSVSIWRDWSENLSEIRGEGGLDCATKMKNGWTSIATWSILSFFGTRSSA